MHQEREVSPHPPAHPQSNYTLFARIRIGALIITAFLLVLEIIPASRIARQPYSGAILNNLTVARVTPGSPAEAAGLQKGDQVVSVNGIPCGIIKDVSECLSRARPGEVIEVGVRRRGRRISVPITLVKLPLSEIMRKVSLAVVGFSFIAIGLLVYFKRTDKVALVFFLFCLAFGLVLTRVVTSDLSPASPAHKYVFTDLMELLLPALFLHFFLLFPQERGILKSRTGLEYLLYAPAAILFLISVYFNVMIFSRGRTYGEGLALFRSATAAYFLVFVIMGLMAFLYAYRHVATDRMKRKLRLVLWGTMVGTLPLIFVRVVLSIEPAIEVPGEKLVFLPLILVPLAFGHAIVRYGLLDLEIVFKKSVVYTLLIAVLASVYFAVVYGIGRLASKFVGSADLLFSILSIFVITLLISPLRARIRTVVDKMFFRQEYNYRKVLKQISHSLAGIIDLESLVSYLGVRIAEVLKARTLVVFLLDEKTGRHTPRYGVRVSHAMLGGFSNQGTLCSLLRRTQATFNAERRLASNYPFPLEPSETDVLLRARSALVVPFIFKSRLLGFMSLGRKMSDEFYSSTDIELLETLCDQVSLAIQNAKLYLETLEKQKMEKELEVAREIQHRLLPKAFPEIPGMRVHAVNIPSEHVGGDYYDIIPLGDHQVGIVIADVSGKGVPAALLMASLQSSLRAEVDSGRQPSTVISVLNQAIFEHTLGDTFVTIFYGLIDFADATMTYCNAGQCPPLILDQQMSVKRLDETDLVMGIDSQASYRDTTVGLQDGDLIFLYTDGITDELSQQDEPYGEQRLLAELQRNRQAGVKELVERVRDAVMQYAGGKPQDDLTVLAIKMVSLAASRTDPDLARKA